MSKTTRALLIVLVAYLIVSYMDYQDHQGAYPVQIAKEMK